MSFNSFNADRELFSDSLVAKSVSHELQNLTLTGRDLHGRAFTLSKAFQQTSRPSQKSAGARDASEYKDYVLRKYG